MRIESYKNSDETILWKGKPNKGVFIKEQIFSPLLPFSIIWILIDVGFIIAFLFNTQDKIPLFFIIPFFILHLAPVWIYIIKIVTSFVRWKNTEYMITDMAIYSLSGVLTTNFTRKSFQEVANVSLHQGIIDKRHDVGDIYVITGKEGTRHSVNILDIEDYMKVYKLVSRISTDIYSDTMYPNDLRPKENHGYNTEYKNEKDFEE